MKRFAYWGGVEVGGLLHGSLGKPPDIKDLSYNAHPE